MSATFAGAVRRGGEPDLPLLREMLYEAEFWRPGLPRPPLDQALSTPPLDAALAGWGRPGDACFVAHAFEDASAVGAAWYRLWSAAEAPSGWLDERTPELGFAVRAPCRRRGAGTALVRAALSAAACAGVPRLSLSVEPDNPARRLCEHLGFRRVSPSGAETLTSARAVAADGSWTMVATLR